MEGGVFVESDVGAGTGEDISMSVSRYIGLEETETRFRKKNKCLLWILFHLFPGPDP